MINAPRIFGLEALDQLSAAARASPRRRKNLDFHPTAAHPAHRLLNAMEPDSYVQPHRHPPPKDETFVVLRGTFGVVVFDDHGEVAECAVIRPGGAAIGADIPAGTFHSIVALEPGSVFLEAKAGPYDPLTAKESAPWAPAEASPEAAAYLERLRELFR